MKRKSNPIGKQTINRLHIDMIQYNEYLYGRGEEDLGHYFCIFILIDIVGLLVIMHIFFLG